MSAWHAGHRERGDTMACPAGMRRMQTFRKLPTIRPSTNTAAAGTSALCHKRLGASRGPRPGVPDGLKGKQEAGKQGRREGTRHKEAKEVKEVEEAEEGHPPGVFL